MKTKKILYSIASLGAAATIAILGTGAFFSDTETSTGNTFTAGAIDLLIDSEAHYAGLVCNGQGVWADDPNVLADTTRPDLLGDPCGGTWTSTDLVAGIHRFFNIDDVKPGDTGENTISMTVEDNDAWACIHIDNMQDLDNTQTEPESEDPDEVDGLASGELAENLHFTAWLDQGNNPGWQGSETDPAEGDNIWQGEPAEPLLFENESGPASDVLGGVTYTLADGQFGVPFAGGVTHYLGLQWCAGTMAISGSTITCDGESMGNEAQTDSLSADIHFYVEQSRNNPEFDCDDVDWPEVVEGVEVGARLASYDVPGDTCNATVTDGNSIQAAIDAASAGQTVCVADGTHDSDTYPLRVNKDNLTLAGVNPPVATAELMGGVVIDNDGVKVTGLKINSSTALSETFGVYVNTGVDNAEVSYNVLTGPGVGSGRGVVNATGTTTNLLVDNNVVSNWLTGVFMNPSTGMVVSYNTLTGNGVGSGNDNPVGNSIHHNVIKNNTVEGVGALLNGAESLSVNFNNIYSNGTDDDLNSYGATTVNAENNWWGDLDPSNNVSGPVDFDPWATSAYSET